MTIETDLTRIADALEKLVSMTGAPSIKEAETPAPKVVKQETQTPAPTSTLLPTSPAPKAAVPPQTVADSAPFKDTPALVAYAMQAYQKLGAVKGSQIQGILKDLGYDNINKVKPEHFAQFKARIEAALSEV